MRELGWNLDTLKYLEPDESKLHGHVGPIVIDIENITKDYVMGEETVPRCAVFVADS